LIEFLVLFDFTAGYVPEMTWHAWTASRKK